MMHNLAILESLDLPLFVPRQPETLPVQHRWVVAVEEIEAAFGSLHQTQLQKIMAYLAQSDYIVLFADTECDVQAQTLLQFGVVKRPPQAGRSIQTLSISQMLTEPACKKQVLYDLQKFKSN